MLTKTIPSYLYQQYSDDDDLQAFVAAFNAMTQAYVDWFNALGLPIYTGVDSLVDSDLLDWVATNLYGLQRPVLAFGGAQTIKGLYNAFQFNTITFNGQKVIPPENVFTTTDDIYRRCLTWLFYKGDGKQFTVSWLKRRIMRFLTVKNGKGGPVDETYRISVTFGPGKQVNINLRNRVVTFGAGAFNTYGYNVRPFNSLDFSVTALKSFQMAPVFKAAVDSGVLELPFQYSWVVNI